MLNIMYLQMVVHVSSSLQTPEAIPVVNWLILFMDMYNKELEERIDK
jgi:hypothetical protein